MTKYFELNDKNVNKDLQEKRRVNLQHQNQYHLDYGTFTLILIHKKRKVQNIEIPGVICGGLCFTLPIILPDLPPDHPKVNLINSSKMAYKVEQEIRKLMSSSSNIYMRLNKNTQRFLQSFTVYLSIYRELFQRLFIHQLIPLVNYFGTNV